LATLGEVEVFRSNARTTQRIVGLNVDGITQEESLIHPQPAGNCLNWVLGHLVFVYNMILPLVKQKPVGNAEQLKRYDRGTAPLTNAAEASDINELMKLWDESVDRFDAGLASLTPEELDAKAPISPRKDPNETVRSLLGLVTFHQAYHAGQLGLLRRVAGKPGAIA
jgi:uncharacterized damage-inducible protein DinB